MVFIELILNFKYEQFHELISVITNCALVQESLVCSSDTFGDCSNDQHFNVN